MRGVYDLVHQLVHARLNIQQVNPRHRHHHVAGAHVGHADHAFQHRAALCAYHVVVFGLRQRLKQLVFGVRAGVEKFDYFFEQRALVCRLSPLRTFTAV